MSRQMALEDEPVSTSLSRSDSSSSMTLAYPMRPGTEASGGVPSADPADAADTADTAVAHPERVGHYQLLEVLGEGGMGTVYLAEQTVPPHRRVALKLVRPGKLDATVLRRFEAEHQALERMSHPYIARVYEAGTGPGGQPYIAMELVAGLPIHEYCDRHRLSLERRLALFAAVCEGVRHAHEKAVLHRDLKPSNILVMEGAGGPVPKIIDFGLAKSLDARARGRKLTGEHSVVGTAAYLSPEAIRLDDTAREVDARSDVYSLGVVLYELLAGLRPFERIGVDLDVLRRALEKGLPKPSERLRQRTQGEQRELARRRGLTATELRRVLDGDLDALVLKAIARDRSDRYASAADLAADVRRYLARKPLFV